MKTRSALHNYSSTSSRLDAGATTITNDTTRSTTAISYRNTTTIDYNYRLQLSTPTIVFGSSSAWLVHNCPEWSWFLFKRSRNNLVYVWLKFGSVSVSAWGLGYSSCLYVFLVRFYSSYCLSRFYTKDLGGASSVAYCSWGLVFGQGFSGMRGGHFRR